MKNWVCEYPGGAQGRITSASSGQFLSTVMPSQPADVAGRGVDNRPSTTFAAAVAEANGLANGRSLESDWKQTPQDWDTIVEKRADGRYDVRRIVNANRPTVLAGVTSLDQAKQLAHEALAPKGSSIWYRDYQAAPGELEVCSS